VRAYWLEIDLLLPIQLLWSKPINEKLPGVRRQLAARGIADTQLNESSEEDDMALLPLHQLVPPSLRSAGTVNCDRTEVARFSSGIMRKFQPVLTRLFPPSTPHPCATHGRVNASEA
jgi:hypothetical protein